MVDSRWSISESDVAVDAVAAGLHDLLLMPGGYGQAVSPQEGEGEGEGF